MPPRPLPLPHTTLLTSHIQQFSDTPAGVCSDTLWGPRSPGRPHPGVRSFARMAHRPQGDTCAGVRGDKGHEGTQRRSGLNRWTGRGLGGPQAWELLCLWRWGASSQKLSDPHGFGVLWGWHHAGAIHHHSISSPRPSLQDRAWGFLLFLATSLPWRPP